MLNLMVLEKIIEHGLTSLQVPFHQLELEDLCRYVTEITRWNERINLVGLKDPVSVVRELLYDAFFLCGHVGGRGSVLDMGSGAGVLAIPLAILNKRERVFSVDRTLKKVQFQRHVQRTLGLVNFYPVHGRIESVEPMNVQCLVAKAFGSITEILSKGGGHVIPGGHAFLLKGTSQEAEHVDGFTLQGITPYALPDSTKPRSLFIYRKLGKV